jgi:hypothetical protein
LPEEFVVSQSDTVADPRAVMVHFQNTLATNGAVVSPRRLDALTFIAIAIVIGVLNRKVVGRYSTRPDC